MTSVLARWSLGLIVAGYLAIAVVAGARESPLTVPVPTGVRPPSWSADLARAVGLDRIGRSGLTGVSWVLVPVVLVAFVLLLREAWSGRVRLSAVLVASGISLAVSVAAPVLLSRDVYTYAAYGRVDAVYHHDPYAVSLSSFPHDPFVAVTPGQWLHTHSVYGPVFTLISAAIARTSGSAGATILAFKLLSGVAIAVATGLVALVATRTRPRRAPLAAALIGLNPVLVVHTVGGAHVDALIAAPLAAAMALAVTRPSVTSARAFAVTVLLTVACLLKTVIAPALALWVWWIVHSRRANRGRILAPHLAVIVGLTLAAVAPFVHGRQTLTPLASLGGVEAWASPSHLVGRGVRAVVGSFAGASAGADAARAVEVAFLLVFVVLLSRLARRTGTSIAAAPADTWGVALLLLALSLPYLLPWYVAWFAPFLGLLADESLLFAGALVTGVLALTLIPADPFHGLTSPAVMNGVHYGAASVLLVILVFVAFRILTYTTAAAGSPDAPPAARSIEVLVARIQTTKPR
jgi:alpha-1,6-mannosyltransferase